MDIRQRKELKQLACRKLEGKDSAKQIILIYTGVILGLSLLVTAINHLLGLEIDKTGGLSNMGTRAVLDTLRQLLPLAQSVIAMCLELGFCAAMLRIAREQYVSHRTLRLGFDRFWPLLRLSLLRGLILMGAAMASMYLGILIYLVSPLSDPVMEILEPFMGNVTTMNPSILLESEIYSQLLTAMIPCFLICGLAALVIVTPLWYHYRLAGYVLIDNPSFGALMALRESKLLMRKNRLNLLKLDLSLWYYPAVLSLVGIIAYGDLLLGMLGVNLPISNDAAFFGFYFLSLLFQGAVYYWLRNRVEVTYCLAYDSLRPEQKEENSIVLGNIFQM